MCSTPAWCQHRAGELGPHVAEFIAQLLGDKVLDHLRAAQAMLRLADKVGAARLDAACRRALVCDRRQLPHRQDDPPARTRE